MRTRSLWVVAPCILSMHAAAATLDSTIPRRFAALAVPFVPNAGQWDERAAFGAHLFAGTLFVTNEGQLVYRLPGKARPTVPAPSARANAVAPGPAGSAPAPGPGWVLTETLVDPEGTALVAMPRGEERREGEVSYAIGADASRHRAGLFAYERVSLGEVYPGISVRLHATGGNVEKIFTIAPGHDPSTIRVRVEGATRLEAGAQGQLLAHTGNGPVAYTAPVAYQEDEAGHRRDVPVRYALDAASGSYGFALGAYDRGRPLVIDPLVQSTYLGGGATDRVYALAIHPVTGEVYVAGQTQSSDFPKVVGAEDTTLGGVGDAFVTRLNAALTTRLQSTYLGGSAEDSALALAIHPATGEVYVGGWTASGDFPKVAGAEQAARAGTSDGFVARLNAALTTIIQATYLGGGSDDQVNALAVDPFTGNVIAAGISYSTDFPKSAGGAQDVKGAGGDGFISRLNAALTSRLQSTYLGGNALDYISALAIHPGTGDIYATGTTMSTDFPHVAGSEQTTHGSDGGLYDAFVSRFNGALTSHVQSTYLGGNSNDQGFGIAVHWMTGEVYVAGTTLSSDFPKAAGSEQPARAAQDDAFVTRLNAGLTTRLQSTYVGGSGIESANAIAIHPFDQNVYVAGNTSSSDFPAVAGGDQSAIGAGDDGFITRLNVALTDRAQSTFMGADGQDKINAIAVHPASGEIYVAGETTSTNFPHVAGAEQATLASMGFYDGFVARISPDLRAPDVYPEPFGFPPKLMVPVGSLQESAPAAIIGIATPVSIYLAGGNNAQYCISSASGCACDVQAYTGATTTISNGRYLCIRQFAPLVSPGVAQASIQVGGGYTSYFVSTGNTLSACSLDVDGNGAQDALTDGLIIIRALFGLTGTSATSAAIGPGATRADWASIRAYLNGNCGAAFQP